MKNWKYIAVWPKSCDYQTEIFKNRKKVDEYLSNYELRNRAQIYKLVPVKKGGRGGK